MLIIKNRTEGAEKSCSILENGSVFPGSDGAWWHTDTEHQSPEQTDSSQLSQLDVWFLLRQWRCPQHLVLNPSDYRRKTSSFVLLRPAGCSWSGGNMNEAPSCGKAAWSRSRPLVMEGCKNTDYSLTYLLKQHKFVWPRCKQTPADPRWRALAAWASPRFRL